MNVLSKLPLIVIGRPEELSFIQRKVADAVMKKTQLYGYVNMGADNPGAAQKNWRHFDMDRVKAEIENIADAGWAGVFIDQFGFDWQNTRDEQNEIVDYAHARGLKCIVNAWQPEDALGTEYDRVYNINSAPTHLREGDWALVESFFSSGDSFRGTDAYTQKYLAFKRYGDAFGVKIMGLTYTKAKINWSEATADIKISYILAQSLGYKGWWFCKSTEDFPFSSEQGSDLDIGIFSKFLTKQADNYYSAETDKYLIEYFALESPYMLLTAKDTSGEIIILSSV
jgi:hypothetical protein